MIDHDAEAAAIVAAHARSATMDPISARVPLTMDDAYRIQALVTGAWLGAGERRIGWKLGYTSLVMRAQMGVDQPNFGPLTDAMLVADGGDVGNRFTQPRVEPEVELRFRSAVPVDADRGAVLDAVESAHAALEIVDSVWTGYRFRIEDNTADGSSAAGVVLGDELPLGRLADVAVSLAVDGTVVGRGHGRDASGHPADGVAWLAARLGERGERVGPGDVVITGGLTAAVALEPGATVTAAFDRVTAVTVRRSRS